MTKEEVVKEVANKMREILEIAKSLETLTENYENQFRETSTKEEWELHTEELESSIEKELGEEFLKEWEMYF